MSTLLDGHDGHEHSGLNIASGFWARAAEAPGARALRIQGVSITYGDLARRAGRLAAALLEAVGGRPDARVGVLAKRSPEAYAAVLGAATAGLAYVPIDTDLPSERQLLMIRRARLDVAVTDGSVDWRVVREAGLTVVGPADAALLDIRPLEKPRPVAPESPAYLMFTSGTTGTPKAVVVTVGNVAHFLRSMRERCPIFPDDQMSQFYELTFDLSIFDIFHGLGSGACLHVVPAAQKMAPAAFIRHENLTVWSSVPSVIGILGQLKQLQPNAFPSLRFSMFCGEPLLARHAEAWREAAPNSVIDNHYGPTEATVSCMGEVIGDPPRTTPNRGVISIGKPFPEMRAAILDADGRFLPQGQIGELALAGPQVAAGYFDEPELTAQRFRTLNHPETGEATYYLTGDLVYEDTEGFFHHLGRIDHQVKILGRRVELEEIEAHLRAVSGGEALAVAWPQKDGVATSVVAFVAGGGDWTEESLREALERRLPSYMVPLQITRRAALPTTANGKLNRATLLRELEQAPHVALV